MKQSTQEIGSSSEKKSCKGITLVEVMLGSVILAILAVLATTSLFYPTYLVVTSGLEQSAIHAGNAEIERHLNSHLSPVPSGEFNTDGWALVSVTTTTNILSESVPGGGVGDEAIYLEISTNIEYRDGKIIDLATYRSLEITSTER